MTDVSIEYAHIYTNDKINEEHETSVNILKEVMQEVGQQSHSLVVLVDDYSFPDPTFDYDSYAEWLSYMGFKPNALIRESQLIPLCDQVLKLIKDEKLHEKLVTYIKAKKYPCSLFIAAWYLARLGHIKGDAVEASLVSKRLINILPLSYKPFEDQGLAIISATEFADSVNSIEYKFLDGRLIA